MRRGNKEFKFCWRHSSKLPGDAPLTPEWFVEDLIRTFEKNSNTQMATPVLRLDEECL